MEITFRVETIYSLITRQRTQIIGKPPMGRNEGQYATNNRRACLNVSLQAQKKSEQFSCLSQVSCVHDQLCRTQKDLLHNTDPSPEMCFFNSNLQFYHHYNLSDKKESNEPFS